MLHILHTPAQSRTPWWPTHQRFPEAPTSIITDCCCCRMRRAETVCRVVSYFDFPKGGLSSPADYQWPKSAWGEEYDRPLFPTGSYCEADVRVECAPDRGCKRNPRRKIGRDLREMWHAHG